MVIRVLEWLMDLRMVAAIYCVLLLAYADPCTVAHGEEIAPAAEFQIGKDGRFILLPVQVGKRSCPMLVDTGCTFSGFDVSLRDRLGDEVGQKALMTPAGPLLATLYLPPKATLGTLPLKGVQQVFCHDFSSVSETSGEQILGVLGMDVLSQWIVQIDFDKGRLRLLPPETEPHADWGREIELVKDPQSRPCIIGRAGASTDVSWLIDTGANGLSVRPELFDRLVGNREIQLGAGFASVTGTGRHDGAAGRLTQVDLEGFRHQYLRCERARPSGLGLNYLARYSITLDMPRMTVYFRPGANFEKPDPPATSGLQLKRINGKTLVVGVKPQGAAIRAGLQLGDDLISVNKQPVHELDFFELRQLLTSRVGLVVPITLRRGEKRLELELKLDSIDSTSEK